MKKLLCGLFLAIIILSVNTSCKKEKDVNAPSLSELRDFTFYGVSNVLNFTYRGTDNQGYDLWDISLGEDFVNSACELDDVTYLDIVYEKGNDNKATLYYEVDFKYYNDYSGIVERDQIQGDLDLTFETYSKTIGLFAKYTGVESGIRDDLRVRNVGFKIANFTETDSKGE